MAKKKNNGDGGENEGEKNKDNNNGGDLKIVLKLHLHCPGCISRIRKSILHFPGVYTVDFEGEDKVKVLGAAIVDVQKLKYRVERKTGKKVEIISPQPKKDNNNNNKDPKKENEKPKETPVKTVMLKVSWHCIGCGERIHKAISSFPGVYEVSIDKEKDQVKVMGKMDPNQLVAELRKKLKRPVEILPEKKDKDKDKSDKPSGGGGGGGGGGQAERGGGPRIDTYWTTWPGYWTGPMGPGWGLDPGQYVEKIYVYPPQTFSDENPNGCSIM